MKDAQQPSEMLTGLPKVPSKELKTKDLVDLAGLSPLPLKLNPKNGSKPEPSDLSLNNNFVIVTPLSTPDVMEVSNTTELTIMPKTESVPMLLIPINPVVVQATLADKTLAPKTLSPSEDTTSSPESLNSNLPTKTDPLLLPSMPEDGLLIPVVSSPTVELPSITPSYLLDIPPDIG